MKLTFLKGIRPDEKSRVLIMLVHSFFQGIIFSLYFTAANTLFVKLENFQNIYFPIAFLLMGGVGFILGQLILNLGKWFGFVARQYMNLLILIAVVGTLYFCLKTMPDYRFYIVFGLFVWIRPLMYVIDLEFWGLAGRLFDFRQSKRLFGLISSGAVISGIIGMFSIPLLLNIIRLGKEELFLITIILLIGWVIFHVFSLRPFKGELSNKQTNTKVNTESSLGKLLKEKYVRHLFAVACLTGICLILVDYNFLQASRIKLNKPVAFANFFSIFFGIMGLLQLFFRTFLTSQIIRRFGTGPGVIALPLLILFFALMQFTFSLPFLSNFEMTLFLSVVCMKMFDQVLRAGIQDPSLQLLYQPFPTMDRIKVQTLVAGTIFPLALTLSGVILYCILQTEIKPLIPTSLIALTLIWLWQGQSFFKEYGPRLHKLLENLREDITPSQSLKLEERDQSAIIHELSSPLKKVRSAALLQLSKMSVEDNPELPHLKTRLNREIEICANLMFAWNDILGEAKEEDLNQHFEEEFKISIANIYEWLAIIFDRNKILLIRQAIEGDSEESRAYSAELLEVIVGTQFRDILLPVLDDIPLEERVRALSEIFVYIPASPESRLRDLVHAPSYAILRSTRNAALHALLTRHPDAQQDLKALLLHPDDKVSLHATEIMTTNR